MTDAQLEDKVKQEQTDKFVCKSCGANMVFSPENNALLCPYCGNKSEILNETGPIAEYDFLEAEKRADQTWGDGTRVIKCDSCGAETILDANSTAQFCAFCGSSHIVEGNKSAGILPESLIPFKVSENNAKQLFSQWIKKRFFAPGAMKNNSQMQKLKGVYIPGWTYDSNTFSSYTGEGGTYYYVQETEWVEENGQRVARTKQVRKTRWWPTSGTYSGYFNDLPVNASKQLDGALMSKLEPFEREELVKYKPEYLSGFFAERYSIGLREGWETVREHIDFELRQAVERQINADEVRNLSIRTSYNDIKFKLTLLPVWISAFIYKNKSYTFMVNGQTGRIAGRYPLSAIKVTLFTLLLLGIVGFLAYLIMK